MTTPLPAALSLCRRCHRSCHQCWRRLWCLWQCCCCGRWPYAYG